MTQQVRAIDVCEHTCHFSSGKTQDGAFRAMERAYKYLEPYRADGRFVVSMRYVDNGYLAMATPISH